tara:strand:- start:326 stop:1816 length:1491 start_codon:yes stop_codon:yes gene_type:complete
MPTKTFLCHYGYGIVKKNFAFKDINRTKKDLNVKPFSAFQVSKFSNQNTSYPVYLESKTKIYMPKFYGLEHFGEPDQNVLDNGYDIELEFNGSLRENQQQPVQAFLTSCKSGPLIEKSNGGIISLPCGGGKTIVALYLISKLKKKTIIVVHKEFLMNQWKERIKTFLPDARVGTIQASTIDIENKDIVICMLQSISMKEYKKDQFDSFGFTIVDECHHISSEVFSRALPKLTSTYTLGLSATPKRQDGMTKVFLWFLGPMLFKGEANKKKCIDIKVVEYKNFDTDYCKEEVTRGGQLCYPRMINNITNYERRTLLIIELIRRLINQNKKILILSDRRNHLKNIYELINKCSLASVGYYVGGMKQKDLDISETKQILLGTYAMSSEGMDIPDLDALILGSPKSNIIQSVGRILRKEHVQNPIVYDIVDQFSKFPNQYIKRRAYYRKMKYPIHIYTVNDSKNRSILEVYSDLDTTPSKDSKNKRKKNEPMNILKFIKD